MISYYLFILDYRTVLDVLTYQHRDVQTTIKKKIPFDNNNKVGLENRGKCLQQIREFLQGIHEYFYRRK